MLARFHFVASNRINKKTVWKLLVPYQIEQVREKNKKRHGVKINLTTKHFAPSSNATTHAGIGRLTDSEAQKVNFNSESTLENIVLKHESMGVCVANLVHFSVDSINKVQEPGSQRFGICCGIFTSVSCLLCLLLNVNCHKWQSE